MNIENKRQFATILLAVGLGLVAAMLMSKVVSDKVDQQTKIIAKEYQGRSAALIKEMDETKQTLKKLAKDHAELAKRVAQQPKTIVQQTAAPTPEKPTIQEMAFSLRTPPGKRAITISINALSAVGGLLNPGDFVDIIGHLDLPDGNDQSSAKKQTAKGEEKVITVLFQNIQVLAVGTNYNPMGEIPPYETQQKAKTLNVTLAVSPEEAGLLTFAEAHGELQLSLRSPAETEERVLQQVASWDALSEFVLEQQGTDLKVPVKKSTIAPGGEEEVGEETKPFIQIFRGGREL
ncbi:MAG: Flp pilus assembly protein CpaB [Candidatus Omnitrophica bacterium]|nr:Flp pilus assembly protein CpaB [Candidatus Omnitrophota bacterium]